jgi:spore coat protein U-like protein
MSNIKNTKHHVRKAAALALALSAAGFISAAHAANTSGQFNVNITLTSSCTLSAIAPVTFAYTSLQGGVANAGGGGFTAQCTNTLPYSFGLQAGNGAATPPGAGSINVTDNGVNLAYQLTLSTASHTADGTAQAYTIAGTMAAGQVGNCALASCDNQTGATASTNRVQTLIVNY